MSARPDTIPSVPPHKKVVLIVDGPSYDFLSQIITRLVSSGYHRLLGVSPGNLGIKGGIEKMEKNLQLIQEHYLPILKTLLTDLKNHIGPFETKEQLAERLKTFGEGKNYNDEQLRLVAALSLAITLKNEVFDPIQDETELASIIENHPEAFLLHQSSLFYKPILSFYKALDALPLEFTDILHPEIAELEFRDLNNMLSIFSPAENIEHQAADPVSNKSTIQEFMHREYQQCRFLTELLEAQDGPFIAQVDLRHALMISRVLEKSALPSEDYLFVYISNIPFDVIDELRTSITPHDPIHQLRDVFSQQPHQKLMIDGTGLTNQAIIDQVCEQVFKCPEAAIPQAPICSVNPGTSRYSMYRPIEEHVFAGSDDPSSDQAPVVVIDPFG
jgi:hypothetical protein